MEVDSTIKLYEMLYQKGHSLSNGFETDKLVIWQEYLKKLKCRVICAKGKTIWQMKDKVIFKNSVTIPEPSTVWVNSSVKNLILDLKKPDRHRAYSTQSSVYVIIDYLIIPKTKAEKILVLGLP